MTMLEQKSEFYIDKNDLILDPKIHLTVNGTWKLNLNDVAIIATKETMNMDDECFLVVFIDKKGNQFPIDSFYIDEFTGVWDVIYERFDIKGDPINEEFKIIYPKALYKQKLYQSPLSSLRAFLNYLAKGLLIKHFGSGVLRQEIITYLEK